MLPRERSQIETFELLDDVFELVRQEFGQICPGRHFDDGADRPVLVMRHLGPGARRVRLLQAEAPHHGNANET